MRTSKRVLMLNLTSFEKNFVRNAAVSTATAAKEDVQLKSWKDIPGPYSLPIIGQIHHFLPGQLFSDLATLQENMYKAYGPLVRFDPSLGTPAMLFVFDAEAAAHILRAENWNPVRPGFPSLEYYRKYYNNSEKESKKPTGLMTDHGENWRYFRTTVNPVMLQPKTVKLYSSQVDEVAQDMVQRIKTIRNEENMIDDFMTEINKWSLESVGVVALGGRLNCFDPNLAEDSPARKLIRCVHDIFNIANELDFKPNLWRYFSTKNFRKGMALYKEQEDLAKYFIDKARKELLVNKKDDDEKGILEKLLEIDERVAVIMACDMLFAGVDTVATTVAGVLYHLAINQDEQDKLRREVTSEDQTKKYLKACIKESLRILPVVSGNMRLSTKEHDILGYRIPKDVSIVFCHQLLSRMDNQFPQADKFIPERWLEYGPLSYKNAHPFAYSPFGFGVRMCIGRRIAELEIETFVSRVIQNFRVEWIGPPPKIEPTSLNYIKGPFNYIFKDV